MREVNKLIKERNGLIRTFEKEPDSCEKEKILALIREKQAEISETIK